MDAHNHCQKCQGSGWVREDHEDRPSALVTDGGCACGGAAVPCVCNPQAIYGGWVEVFASNDPAHRPTGPVH